jgi:hypothetical protein
MDVKAQHIALPAEPTELPEHRVIREGHCGETTVVLQQRVPGFTL